MSRVIAIANQKGGVGKTTTAINLGASLAVMEKRCLLIDLDPQGNTSSGLSVEKSSPTGSLYGSLLDLTPLGSAVSRAVHFPFLDVVPATVDLVGAEVELARMSDGVLRLRWALAGVRDLYDFVLLDCPPALGLLSVNALAAADGVLIPIQAEFFALEGLVQLKKNIELIRRELNPGLQVEGLLLTMYDGRLNLSRQVAEEVKGVFGPQLLETVIPRNVRLAEAPSFGKAALEYDIRSAGAQSYLALARELIRRPSQAPATRPAVA